MLAYQGLGPLGVPLGWAIGAFATLVLSLFLWKGKLPRTNGFPARPFLAFSLPLFASALITLVQGWGDIALLQGVLGQFGTTGDYIVVSSVTFLSILWIPAAGALYPAQSRSYASDGPRAVSARLAVAMRLVNLTVLPTGGALAAIAPTALGAVYGASLANQAVPFAILAVTLIFSAQGVLLITTLQAIGRTTRILGISLAAVMVDLAAVGLGAYALGTTAGAVGRALLAAVTMLLAWLSLRGVLHAPITQGLSKAGVLTVLSATTLLIIDYLLTFTLQLTPLSRIPVLLAAYLICFLAVSRTLSLFDEDDFNILENALPRFLHPGVAVIEGVLIPTRKRTQHFRR